MKHEIAQKQNAILWTQDEHFRSLRGVKYRPAPRPPKPRKAQ